jgi:nitrate/nitrite transporter NarK
VCDTKMAIQRFSSMGSLDLDSSDKWLSKKENSPRSRTVTASSSAAFGPTAKQYEQYKLLGFVRPATENDWRYGFGSQSKRRTTTATITLLLVQLIQLFYFDNILASQQAHVIGILCGSMGGMVIGCLFGGGLAIIDRFRCKVSHGTALEVFASIRTSAAIGACCGTIGAAVITGVGVPVTVDFKEASTVLHSILTVLCFASLCGQLTINPTCRAYRELYKRNDKRITLKDMRESWKRKRKAYESTSNMIYWTTFAVLLMSMMISLPWICLEDYSCSHDQPGKAPQYVPYLTACGITIKSSCHLHVRHERPAGFVLLWTPP